MRAAPPPDPAQPEAAWSEAVLSRINSATAVVAVAPNFWLDGARLDLAAVAARSREVGAALVVDATQSVGAVPFDVAEIQPDFMMVAGYKWMLCPYRLAFLYAAPQYHAEGRSIEQHGWCGPPFSALLHPTRLLACPARARIAAPACVPY
eukprot:COSAG04_NODE_975_length_9058_cov_11.488894_6_plen_150_part_00